jgi:hypothetical protein
MSQLKMTLEGSLPDIQKVISILIKYSDLTVRYIIRHPQERDFNQVELILKEMKEGQIPAEVQFNKLYYNVASSLSNTSVGRKL